MDRLLEQSLLYDFYGELLNEHQKSIYEDFVLNDLSLSEIAEQQGISRQGVHDLVKRCNISLKAYEDKLHLVEKFISTKKMITQIHKLTKEFEENQELNIIKEIEMITNKILEEL